MTVHDNRLVLNIMAAAVLLTWDYYGHANKVIKPM
jgi:hypothetical protein